MTAVTGAGRSSTRRSLPGRRARPDLRTGADAAPPLRPVEDYPALRFPALVGLCGLAVPFVLAFALRSQIAELNPPAVVQYVADGGYVLISALFVLFGFLLCRPLTAVVANFSGASPRNATIAIGRSVVRRILPLHLLALAITLAWAVTSTRPGSLWGWLSSAWLLNGLVGPEGTGYPVSWAVSAAASALVLLVVAALIGGSIHRRRRPKPTRPTTFPTQPTRPTTQQARSATQHPRPTTQPTRPSQAAAQLPGPPPSRPGRASSQAGPTPSRPDPPTNPPAPPPSRAGRAPSRLGPPPARPRPTPQQCAPPRSNPPPRNCPPPEPDQ